MKWDEEMFSRVSRVVVVVGVYYPLNRRDMRTSHLPNLPVVYAFIGKTMINQRNLTSTGCNLIGMIYNTNKRAATSER